MMPRSTHPDTPQKNTQGKHFSLRVWPVLQRLPMSPGLLPSGQLDADITAAACSTKQQGAQLTNNTDFGRLPVVTLRPQRAGIEALVAPLSPMQNSTALGKHTRALLVRAARD